MQQRIYCGADVSPEDLGAHLVAQYAQTRRMRAQIMGAGTSLAVQIGRDGRAPAMTVGIVQSPDDARDIIVTMGEQQWISNDSALSAAAGSLVGALYSPFALFGLIWPVKHILRGDHSPQDAWSSIDAYMIQHGAVLATDQTLTHPHMEE